MINIAVCDDESQAAADLEHRIRHYMKQKNHLCTVRNFTTGEALLLYLARSGNPFDVIYLDIKMNHMSGIDVARSIRETGHDTMIVFVTALKEYVFDAFEVQALNYLVKPVEEMKLVSALEKVIKTVEMPENRGLMLQNKGVIRKVPFADIVYCEVLNHKVFVYEKKDTLLYHSKIDDLEQELDDTFFRCHRSYIINLNHVESYENGIAGVSSGERIPVATRRQKEFGKALLHNRVAAVR